jgi:hypothetical protein
MSALGWITLRALLLCLYLNSIARMNQVDQVRAEGMGAIAQMLGENTPRDLLIGRAFWAGETSVVFTLPSCAVR